MASNFEFNSSIASKLGGDGSRKGKLNSTPMINNGSKDFSYKGQFNINGGRLPDDFDTRIKLPQMEVKQYNTFTGERYVAENNSALASTPEPTYADRLAIASSIASAIVNHRNKINAFFKKYGIDSESLNDKEVLALINQYLFTNPDFAKSFSSMIVNINKGNGAMGALSNKSAKKHRNFIDAIANAIGGVAGMVGNIVNQSPKAREQQQALMAQQLELARIEKEKEEMSNKRKVYLYVGLGVVGLGLLGLTAYLILRKKK